MKKVLIKYSIFTSLIIIFSLWGCGIKGNPVTLSTVPGNIRIVQNMRASASGNAIILKWDFQDKDYKRGYIAIEKSELGSMGNECKNCPRKYDRIGRVSLKVGKYENSSLSFIDKKVQKGKAYKYRLMLCDDFNICFENDSTEINY